jgi:RNA polymerase sigma-70 factor (ECF subfamily)
VEYTDTELIQLTLKGEKEAFGELIHRYQDAVYATALHRIGEFTSAQDVAQETFIEAYKSLHTLSEPVKFPGWLHTITLRQCNRWRRKQKDTTPLDDPHVTILSGMIIPSPDEEVEYGEFRNKVLNAITSLPEKTGEVVTMYYIDGLSYGEIADFLSMPVTTVKGRLQMGRKQLKEELITMVEDVLKSNRPDEKFSDKVLEEIIKQSEVANENRSHEELIQLCDKALEVLEHLEATEERKRKKIDVLRLQGYELLDWFAKPEKALSNFRHIANIAADMGDLGLQATWLLMQARAISRTENYKAMLEPVKKAYEIYNKLGDIYGQVVCEAIFDLLSLLPDGWQPSDIYNRVMFTGYRIYAYRLLHTGDSISYTEDSPKEYKAFTTLIGYVGYDMWRWNSLLALVGQIKDILRLPPVVNLTWNDSITERHYNQTFQATRVIEANCDTVIVPAGRFENCLRVVTSIIEPLDTDFSDSSKVFRRQEMCGKQTVWFAPGVGIVKFRHEDIRGGSVSFQLVKYNVTDNRDNDYFPLHVGNWWRYERYTNWLSELITENYRIIIKDNDSVYIACAVYSEVLGKDKHIEYLGVCRNNEGASSDARGEFAVLSHLMEVYANSGDLDSTLDAYQKAIQLAEKMQEPLLKAMISLHALSCIADTPWDSRMDNIIADTEYALNVIKGVDQYTYQERLHWVMDFYLRHDRYEKALEYAKLALEVITTLENTDELLMNEAEIDLADTLIHDPDGKYAIKGGLRTYVIVNQSESGIICKRQSSITPMRLGARPLPPVYDYEIETDALLLRYPLTAGEKWSFNGYSHIVERSVESDNEIMTVPAGRFDKVICIKSSVQLQPDDGVTEDIKKKYEIKKGFREGEKRLWFAQGIGLIRTEHHHANGKRTVVELTDYNITNTDDSYFPLDIGNKWNYEWRNENGDLLFKERERVILKQDDGFYLACSGYTTNTDEYGKNE